jgi:hypothetical protein
MGARLLGCDVLKRSMNLFLLKIILMPLVIGGITKASKIWGNAIGGLIASLPWVAAPIILFFVIEQGIDFAVNSIKGVMMGLVGVIAFCYAYILTCFSFKWWVCLIFGYVAFVASTVFLKLFESKLTLNEWYFLTMGITITALYFYPKLKPQQTAAQSLKYDIYLRMGAITIFVVLITYLAKILGPTWSGILTPFPIVTAILAAFTHYTQGPNGTLTILKGFMTGFVGFGTYLYLQAKFLPIFTVLTSIILAIAINILLNIMMRSLVEKSSFFSFKYSK